MFYEKELEINYNKLSSKQDYYEAIRPILNIFNNNPNLKIDLTTGFNKSLIKMHDDNSISIGICTKYRASISPKLICPFDTRYKMSADYDIKLDDLFEKTDYEETHFNPYDNNENERPQHQKYFTCQCQYYCAIMLPKYWDIENNPNAQYGEKRIYRINEDGHKLAIQMIKDFKLRF